MKATPGYLLFFGCVGAIFLVACGFTGLHTWRFIHTASHATGKVTRQNHGCAHVEIHFETAADAAVDYPQNGAVCLQAGQEVQVLYDPSLPKLTATVDSFGALWGATFWAGGLGIAFLAGAIFMRAGSRFIYLKPGR
ncbi:DUF3592 domain-containing protein [Dyella sp. GSA-30]|uniref:DUF3592 domain-containing protein n=1 Tax=Dyella sp. GSA-30 TaxID=2994496 RepID=UPI0024922DFD|nr:DUF3592 domain-containing protein [Dyella sp. GSA-30]BDU21729.1 hypothetical protein DYGSA30_31860 [Dyella sp. GSA-30]